jgi:hypothetical protein
MIYTGTISECSDSLCAVSALSVTAVLNGSNIEDRLIIAADSGIEASHLFFGNAMLSEVYLFLVDGCFLRFLFAPLEIYGLAYTTLGPPRTTD